MWELDYKESWVPKNWCFWTVVLEKTLESPLVSKEIQPVHPKENQSWIFIRRTDTEAETAILGHLMWRADSWKDPDAGKDRAGGEGDDRGWDGWMASLTQWTWVWVSSRNCWWTGRPDLLQSMGLQKVAKSSLELLITRSTFLCITYVAWHITEVPQIFVDLVCFCSSVYLFL